MKVPVFDQALIRLQHCVVETIVVCFLVISCKKAMGFEKYNIKIKTMENYKLNRYY